MINAEDYLFLVQTIIDSYFRDFKYNDREELIGVGNLALVLAARDFNPEKMESFKTFAGLKILYAIRDYQRKLIGRTSHKKPGLLGNLGIDDQMVLSRRASSSITTDQSADRLASQISKLDTAQSSKDLLIDYYCNGLSHSAIARKQGKLPTQVVRALDRVRASQTMRKFEKLVSDEVELLCPY